MKAVKVGDIGTEHDGFHLTKVTAGSPDVFIDGQPAARVGDPLEPHDKPKHPKHGRTIATGSSTVFINGRPAALTGGKISCGGVTIGSGTVNIGDQYTPASTSTSTPKLKPVFNRKFIIRDRDGNPIPNCEYKLELEDGKTITGTTTLDGETDFAFSKESSVSAKIYTRGLEMPEKHWRLRHDTEKLTASCHNDPITLNLEPDEFVDLVVLSVEEARELWINVNGKDIAGYGNTAFGAKNEYVYAQKVAKSLGGYATQWYVKVINDKPYIILKGYNRQLKTLLAGNIWKATNPKLVQFGIGPGAIKASLKGNIIITIFFSVAVNAVDTMVNDEKTMIDFLGNTGSDIVKGLTALGVASVSLAVFAAIGVPVSLIGGSVFLFVASTGLNGLLNEMDNSCGVTSSFVAYWKKSDAEAKKNEEKQFDEYSLMP